jgi:TfoX-like protein
VPVDADFIRDLFAAFGPVTVRRMFSGAGIFADGLMFGLIVRDVIYLKADDTSTADFEREGCARFTYTRGRHPTGRASTLCPIGGCLNGSTTTPTSLRCGRSARFRRRSGRN